VRQLELSGHVGAGGQTRHRCRVEIGAKLRKRFGGRRGIRAESQHGERGSEQRAH
jgi:hypothetical protein